MAGIGLNGVRTMKIHSRTETLRVNTGLTYTHLLRSFGGPNDLNIIDLLDQVL
jgi:hypothetical protein